MMVDERMRELQKHGNPCFPVGAYEWYGKPGNATALECHWHDEWEFFRLTKGRAHMAVDGARVSLRAGDVVFIPGGRMHLAECAEDAPFEYRAIVFDPSFLHIPSDDMVETKYIIPLLEGGIAMDRLYPVDRDDGRMARDFDRLFAALMERPRPYELYAKARLFELIADGIALGADGTEVAREDAASDSCAHSIKALITYIHEHYASPLSVAQLSEMSRLSPGYLTRRFKQYTANSPVDYIIRLRLVKAADLLVNTDDKLMNVAMTVGFNNLSYFIRKFENQFRCSPTCYRKYGGTPPWDELAN